MHEAASVGPAAVAVGCVGSVGKVGEWWAGPGGGKARHRTSDLCHWSWSGGGLITWLKLPVWCGVE